MPPSHGAFGNARTDLDQLGAWAATFIGLTRQLIVTTLHGAMPD